MTPAEFKKLRERVGSQRRVAALLEVHPITVAKWETGVLPIASERAAQIKKLAKDRPASRATISKVTEVSFKTPDYTPGVANASSSSGVTIRRADGSEQHLLIQSGQRVRLTASGDVIVEPGTGT